MKRQKIFNWSPVVLAALALILVSLPGQLDSPALAQEDAALLFIENVGQFPGNNQTRFLVNTGQMTLRLADDALWVTVLESPQLDPPAQPDASIANQEPDITSRRGVNLRLSFVDANPQPRLEPFNRLNRQVSYFTGSDPANWHTNVPVWGGVRYVDLYPGVDLEITAKNGQLVQRLVVRQSQAVAAQSSFSVQDVSLQVEGADDVAVEGGRLRVNTELGRLNLPLLQLVDDNNLPVEISAAEAGVTGAGRVVAPFASQEEAEAATRSQAISAAGVSDLQYSTFLGGEGTFDNGHAIAVDEEGYAYVTGQADPGFPTTPGAFDTSIDGVFNDVFVAKLTPDGSDLVFATFIGGSDWETSHGIYVDEAGDVIIAGHTTSTDWPTTPDAVDDTLDGDSDAFVAKLNSTGTNLLYATLFGGSQNDFAWGLAADQAGDVYVTGTTYSEDFPTTPGAFDTVNDLAEAYAVKLNLGSPQFEYATYLGGQSFESGYHVAVDEAGHAYVSGRTGSVDFPVTEGAFDTTLSQTDGFVVKLAPDGTDAVFSTLIGGSQSESAESLALDPAGNVYVTGNTWSEDYPTTPGALSTVCGNCQFTSLTDAFVSKLSADGSTLLYSTFLGGQEPDFGMAIAVSDAGRAYVTGYTYSADFPTTPDAFDTVCEGCSETISQADTFVVRLNPQGAALDYGTFLGGNGGPELAGGLVTDNNGAAYIVGFTTSEDFPITDGAYDPILEGFYDVFISKLATGSDEPAPEPTPTPTPEPTPVPEHTCAPTLLGEITVGDTPRGVAIDPGRNRVYVANAGSNSVSVIDAATNSLLHTITGITSATGIAYDATNDIIWVTNHELDLLTPIQAADNPNDFVVHLAMLVGDGPWGVAYNPANNYVYVANSLDSSVTIVDATTREVLTTLAEPFNRPYHLAANTATGKVYVANSGHNSVTILDGLSVGSVAQLWDSGRAYGIAVDETRDTVYVATIETNRIVALGPLNGQPDQFLGWASFQRGYNPNRRVPLRAIAVNPQIGPLFDGGHIWATTATLDGSEANQALFIPKGWSSRFHVPFATDVGSNPTDGIAVDRQNSRVYVTSGDTPGTLTVIGDHETICGGVAPASVAEPTNDDQITFDVYSVANVILSDVNEDGIVDIFDLTSVAARFGSNDPAADLNEDGIVDIFDLTLIAGNFGKQLPENTP